jgi:hypothetical protein
VRKKIEDRYRVLEDYLPNNYSIEHESYLTEDNDMTFEIILLDNNEDIIEFVYCTPETFQESIHDIINYAWKDYRDKKISNIIDGTN